MNIHPTTLRHESAHIYPGVKIGKDCIIREGVVIEYGAVIGENNYIGPNSKVYSNVTIGDNNIFEGMNYVGTPPEHREYEHKCIGKVTIGSNNIFYPLARVYSPCRSDLTSIADSNYFMGNCHIGHDTKVGSFCNFAPNTVTGRNVIMNRVFMGLNSCMHTLVLVPEGCIIGMGSVLTKHIILQPYSMIMGNPAKVAGMNARGLERSGKTPEEMEQIKHNFNTNILNEM